MDHNIAFSYIKGDSLIHKCPAWIKILFIPFINILFFNLPIQYCIFLIVIQFIICFTLKFSLKQQAADLKPVIYYGFLLLIMNLLIFIFSNGFEQLYKSILIGIRNPLEIIKSLPKNETFIMLVKLFCILQSTSIFFKTSTNLQIRQGLEEIELSIRKILHLKKRCTVANAIALFLNFIPMVWQIWNQLKKAWFARKGKSGVTMFLKLMPVLFSVGMKKAWNTARAVSIRSENVLN